MTAGDPNAEAHEHRSYAFGAWARAWTEVTRVCAT